MSHESVQARAIFIEAVENVPPERWRDYLVKACGNDDALRDKVQRLLEAHGSIGGFMEKPAAAPIATADEPITEKPGALIGPYKLREQIGEGGMGVVFVAEQTEPVRRKVALKIVKPGMASRDVLARFEAERQALALMDHPNIARVFDGGVTETDQPYFVMELIQGPPITEFCDQQRFSNPERLKLFAKVCRAVQHAHRRGVIHRDLKPSNVLVPRLDGTPVPKVIDFGVAKAIGQKLTEHTVYTQFAQMVGTPLYMSPEQAELGVVDVDTRSDVYALGVMLYELLTGSTPFDNQTLKQASFDEIRRIIREDDPQRPSARISTLNAEALSTVSQRRASDPKDLSNGLKGELDCIVMKALDKDRNRRYESASALAEDVERYLRDEPIKARPSSRWYLLQKFARRNRALVASVAAVTVAITIGVFLATVGLVHAIRQRDRAREHLAEAVEARKATDKAIALLWNEFVPETAWGRQGERESLTVRDALTHMEVTLAEQLQDEPQVELRIRKLIADHYASIRSPADVRLHLSRALALAKELYGDSHEEVADVYVALANTLQYSWTDGPRWNWHEPIDVDEYGQYARSALAIHEALGIRNGNTSHACFCLSLSLTEPHEHQEAEACLRRALRIADEFKKGQHVFARVDLADFLALGNKTDIEEAHVFYEEALAQLDELPADRRTLKATALSCRGRCCRVHDTARAIQDYEIAWSIYRDEDKFKNELRGHTYALDLAELYLLTNQRDQAMRVIGEVEQICEQSNLKKSLAELSYFKGWSQFLNAEFGAAAKDFTTALTFAEDSYSDAHSMTMYCRFYLAESMRRQGRDDQARDFYQLVERQTRPWLAIEKWPVVIPWMHAIAIINGYAAPDEATLDEAIVAIERALRIAAAWQKPNLHLVKATAYHKLGRLEDAIAELKKGLAAWTGPTPSLNDIRKGIPTTRRALETALNEYMTN